MATTKQPSRNGNSKYANFDLEDPSGIVRCICWPDDYARLCEIIKPESVVIVKGRIDGRGREPNIILNKLYTIADAEKEFTKRVVIKFSRGRHTEQDMKRTRDVLARHPGKTDVLLFVDTWEENGANETASSTLTAEESRTPLRCILTTSMTVGCTPELRRELSDSLGSDGFRFLSSGD